MKLLQHILLGYVAGWGSIDKMTFFEWTSIVMCLVALAMTAVRKAAVEMLFEDCL
jgi:hypothetical protein